MKILIFGATGMIGHRMWSSLGLLHDVYATVRQSNLNKLSLFPGINEKKCFFNIHAENIEEIERVVKEVKPNIVLNCIGIIKQLKESNNHIKSIYCNALFPHKLASICNKYKVRMIQFSSDCVFNGETGDYTENIMPNACDLYGQTKAMGEINYLSNVVTIRTSTIGRELNSHGGLLEWFLSQKEAVNGFSNALYTGFTTITLAKILDMYIIPNKNICGIVHVSSDSIDKYSLLNLIKKELNLDIEIKKNNTFIMKRNLNSLSFRKKVNFNPISWEEMLKDLQVDIELYTGN